MIQRAAGITPAYAGKSRYRSLCAAACRDHPRVCGEKISFFFTGCSPKGSPPRMRGKAEEQRRRCDVQRITPAYAGKSHSGLYGSTNEKDHPRVCGEKQFKSLNQNQQQGSPPRMRGKGRRKQILLEFSGITPACAGKSGPISASGRAIRDHPRVCGEKALHDGGILPAQGSPPRVRGKVVVSRNLCLLSGITPACAGKSELQALVLSGQRDHPRVCGEKRRKRQSV